MDKKKKIKLVYLMMINRGNVTERTQTLTWSTQTMQLATLHTCTFEH